MNTNELAGTLALVHPEISNDPFHRAGEVGMITYVSHQEHHVYLRFDDGQDAIYAADAVLILKEKNALLADLEKNTNAKISDLTALYKISVLQDLGRPADTIRALTLAAKHHGIRNSALQTVDAVLSFERPRVIGR